MHTGIGKLAPRTVAAFLGFWLLLLASFKGGEGLRLLRLEVPSHTVRPMAAKMECEYDLEGMTLYSVKWYKDGHEFFRYMPLDTPPHLAFHVPGIHVNMELSTPHVVWLHNVTLHSSGRYRCEVSAEAPSFETVSECADMAVVAIPKDGPQISGSKRRYQINELVRVNCTSGRSKPPSVLSWFINGEQADERLVNGPYVLKHGHDGLEVTQLGLQFHVQPHHFMRGDLKLKCLATIATVYWKSNEESAEPERPLRAPALESRESRAPAEKNHVRWVHDPPDFPLGSELTATSDTPNAIFGSGSALRSGFSGTMILCYCIYAVSVSLYDLAF